MNTFKELQDRLNLSKTKSTILEHLVAYLEDQFRPTPGGTVKKVLVTEEKIPVPDSAYEDVTIDLLRGIQMMRDEMQSILASAVVSSPVAEPQPTMPNQGDLQ